MKAKSTVNSAGVYTIKQPKSVAKKVAGYR